ncbi:RrF2 family transcriptional regulator [Scatolibacter rhodanostii]|uniref:RrF2 family transcriptional regulator n=1 Tax=Scatolibacter rhodanostii TaxID=2014781 RepID=UPI000C0697E5|nr:Rrf2 family transcriptional regulator [Scatolibacter rhodanostii]
MTLEADYAVRVVEYLTENNSKVDAKTISANTEIPPRFLLKILRKLVESGIACSFKGAKGGYKLAKPPKEITLRQVIEAVDGTYMMFSKCGSSAYNCGRTSCHLHSIYSQISSEVRQKLDSYNFAILCGLEENS